MVLEGVNVPLSKCLEMEKLRCRFSACRIRGVEKTGGDVTR